MQIKALCNRPLLPLPGAAGLRFVTKTVLIMKMIFFLLTAAFLQVQATGWSQTISLSGKNIPLRKVFDAIELQSGYVAFTTKDLLAGTKPVTLHVQGMELTGFLNLVLKDQPIGYRVEGKTIMLIKKNTGAMAAPASPPADPIRVTGTVTDAGGQPLAGATIRIKGKNSSVFSDDKGHFEIMAEPGALLLVSYIGFEQKEYRAGGGDTRIILQRAQKNLDTTEVVINTGYQAIRKTRSTGAVTVITEKDLERKVSGNVLNMLEGMVPGLTLFRSGYGAENNEINIRGVASISANREPLIIIDGFPADRMEMEDDPTLTGREDGATFNSRFIAGGALSLNPENIANITVLKDAAATAIYGARASNGVIVITTKSGRQGPAKVTYAGNFQFSPTPDLGYYNRLSAAEFVDLQQALFNQNHTAYTTFSTSKTAVNKVLEALYANKYEGMSNDALTGRLDALRNSDNTAQIKDNMMRPYFGMQHNIIISGASNMHNYSVSFGYNRENLQDIKTGNQRFNVQIKERMTVKPWLIVSGQVTVSIAKSTGNNSYSDPLNSYARYPAFEMLLNPDGSYQYWNRGWKGVYQDTLVMQGLKSERWNPLEEGNYINVEKQSDYVRLQAGVEGSLPAGLRYTTRFSIDRSSTTDQFLQAENGYFPRLLANGATTRDATTGLLKNNIPNGGMYNEVKTNGRPWTFNAQLDYNRTFRRRHNVSALAGFEARQTYTQQLSVEVLGYNDKTKSWPQQNQTLGYINGGLGSFPFYGWNAVVPHNWARYSDNRWISFYGNASYAYQEKYIVTGSMRIDQANLFGTDPKYRYKPLWSAGVKWNAKGESFLKGVKAVDLLSLRLSYGFNGNTSNASSPFLILNTNNYETYTGSGLPYTTITSPPNTRLRWEETGSINLGLDFGVLHNRIRGSVDYYRKETRDMLGAVDVDPTVGFSNVTKNFARMKNDGIEVSLITANIDTRDFDWTTTFNYAYNKNTVLENYNKQSYLTITNGNVFEAGYPAFAVFGVKWAGLDPQDGRARIYANIDRRTGLDAGTQTIKKDNGGTPTVNDVYYHGLKRPHTALGIKNTFRYKNFIAEFFLVGNFGAITRVDLPLANPANVVPDYANGLLRRRWSKPGDELTTNIPSSTIYWGTAPSAFYWYSADVFAVSANYVKLREVSLSYTIPAALLRKTSLSSARLLLQGQNLFSWFANDYNIDPEAHSFTSGGGVRTLPTPKTFIIGINLSF